ncbi:MAG: hypothetical protein J7L39_03895 [Candidatus Aenigmarchaeota archaeon]|nr:hypothetical protein [Candidatus Aenigmarchaeota archaeon]
MKEKKIKKPRQSKKYPLPRADMSFENEIAVLKAIYEFSNRGKKPITYKDVRVPKVSPTRISSEFNFLASINLIAQGKKRGEYIPTKEIIEFVNNINWDKETEAKGIIRKILLNTWFGNMTVRLLKVKELSLDELISELGKQAVADPKKDKKGVKRLIEWLKYAEIIDVDNNKVKLKKATQIPQKETKEEIEVSKIIPSEKEKLPESIGINVSFMIKIDPDTKKEEIIKTIKTIKDVLKELNAERD